MLQPNSPGVYVEPISTAIPNVVQILEDIPAFVGMPARIPQLGNNIPLRITSLIDYESYFGRATYPNNFQIDLTNNSGTLKITRVQQHPMAQRAVLYYAMKLYFSNGGGPCYIVPIEEASKANYTAAIEALTAIDEVSLLLLPDAGLLLNAADYYEICNTVLQHCGSSTNRFAILDVLDTIDAVQQFRDHVVTNLRDGAAYTPYLDSNFSFEYDEANVNVSINSAEAVAMSNLIPTQSEVYNFIKTTLESDPKVILPPSAAIAGIYVRLYRERGVWKAPANVGIVGIRGTTKNITQDEQGALNVDPVSGKSINAIKSVPGKGTLVWGARTLAGNDNDYRYISVRRFLSVVEATLHKASRPAVLLPNDPLTWNAVKAMAENYLQNLWREGALQGASPEKAYFVAVGLGSTMTSQDLLDGKVILQIGLAVIRPAEFMIINIAHSPETETPTNTPPMTLEAQTHTLMQTTMDWSDLVLEPQTQEHLKDIVDWMSYNQTLLNDWGMAGKVRQGLSILFHGPSGTGKTLSATLIGKTVKRPVYRVDLSQVLSKYIGETEKNLSLILQRAETQGGILLFDEADAIFGKRTDVANTHDRYANQEVSYLLQRIEKHSGLVIFTTNTKEDVNHDSISRMDMVVEFSMPDKDARLLLWKQNIPAKATLARDIDLKNLAETHELSGGAIMNVIFHASLQALKKRTNTIELSDLSKGIEKELSRQAMG